MEWEEAAHKCVFGLYAFEASSSPLISIYPLLPTSTNHHYRSTAIFKMGGKKEAVVVGWQQFDTH